MLLVNRILWAVIAVITFVSCQKNKPCLPPRTEISGSDQIFSGETINLQAATVDGASYSWAGPNAFSSTEQNPSIQNATVKASGTYTLKVKAGECENSVAKDITVMQGAGCAPADNTIAFYSTMTFSTIKSGLNAVGRYEISGTGMQGDFRITFYNDPIAKGSTVYILSTQDHTPYNAFMQIDAGGVYTNWQATSGKLYVSVTNGKLTVTFCDATFLNIQSSYTKTASGKIKCS